MVYAAISPQAALVSTCGESLQGPAAEIVVRNGGALLALIGATLIYGTFHPAHRRLILVHGARHLSRAGVAVAVDSVMTH